MERPDLATLSCVNVEYHYFGRSHQGHLASRKVYGQDRMRLLRGGKCREEFSERRNTAWFNTKVKEAKAEAVIDHLDEGCSIRSTSRLMKVAKETVARLLKTTRVKLKKNVTQVRHTTETHAHRVDTPGQGVSIT